MIVKRALYPKPSFFDASYPKGYLTLDKEWLIKKIFFGVNLNNNSFYSCRIKFFIVYLKIFYKNKKGN